MRRIGAMHPDRIAIVRALHLGDMLVAVPALRAIRARFPRAEVTLIGLPWARELVNRFSAYVDRWLEFPGWPGIEEVPHSEAKTRAFLERERRDPYDLVIQMHGSGTHSNGFARALEGRLTAGFYPAGSEVDRPDITAPYPHDLPEIHRNLRLAELLGCSRLSEDLEFPISSREVAEARELLGLVPPGKPLVGVHPGASAPARRWPVERFARVADRFAESYDARVVLTGGPDEIETVQRTARLMRSEALNLAGRTSLGSLAAVIDRCDLYISNDTGPSHIAVARGTPSVVIFGPADVKRWAPLNQMRHKVAHHPVFCNPCTYQVCPIDHGCMDRVKTVEVTHLADRLLGGVVA